MTPPWRRPWFYLYCLFLVNEQKEMDSVIVAEKHYSVKNTTNDRLGMEMDCFGKEHCSLTFESSPLYCQG